MGRMKELSLMKEEMAIESLDTGSKPGKDFYDEIYKKLSAPFPMESMRTFQSSGYSSTTIQAQYIRERLNEVLGVQGWSTISEVIHSSEGGNVVIKMKLTLIFDGYGRITRCAFGGASPKNKNQSYGDIFKSAETDALSKAASNFGVGNDVFKGLVEDAGPSYGTHVNVKDSTKPDSTKPDSTRFQGFRITEGGLEW